MDLHTTVKESSFYELLENLYFYEYFYYASILGCGWVDSRLLIL